MKNLHRMVFIAVALVQLAVPAVMIHRWESTLRHGDAFKFRTAPVDPYDAFRGRFVALRLESQTVTVPEGRMAPTRGIVFATVAVDTNGFAYLRDVNENKPHDEPYIRARVNYGSGTNVILDLPIDRFYMNEKLAPEAEKAYWQHNVRTNHDAFVMVRVRDGDAVVENLYINNRPVIDFLKETSPSP